MQHVYSRHKSARRSGITLIELLVVIAIMAIVASLSIPAFTGMGRGAAMRGAVAEITSTLALARQWAITKREPVTFDYGNDSTGAFYSVSVYVIDPTGVDTTFIQSAKYLDIGIYFADNDSMTFKTDGGLEQGSTTHRITITNIQAITNIITVNGLTGGITVK